MPEIIKFRIKNFKGIENTEISISGRIETPIVTLVGLNESGKTTLLEALSHFVTGDPIISKIFDDAGASSEALSLIPIHRKANFTGDIEISADVVFDDNDINDILRLAKRSFRLEIDEEPLRAPINIAKVFRFRDGNLDSKGSRPTWSAQLITKSSRAKSFTTYKRPSEGRDLMSEVWQLATSRLPEISYFPTFLVNLPSRIYLSEHPNETATNRHYRSVLQDVLDSLDEGLDLEKHVAKRIRDFREADENPNWISLFWGTPGRSQISSVFQKISNAISKEIIGSWNKVFHRPISAKNISVDWNIDTEKGYLPYAEIFISDGESQYALHERSLGFRWFFSFLLFTRFRHAKNRRTVFLFDEPAANLHARGRPNYWRVLRGFWKVAIELSTLRTVII